MRISAPIDVPARGVIKIRLFHGGRLGLRLEIRPVGTWNVIEMDSDDPFWVAQSQGGRDAGAEVSALHGETIVSQLGHQPGPQIGDAEKIHAGLRWPVGES